MTLKCSFHVSFCPPSTHPSHHKKLLLTLSLSDVRRPMSDVRCLTWGQYSGINSIRCLHFRAKHFRAKHFRAKHFRAKHFWANLQASPNSKHHIGLTPLYWPQARRRMSNRGNVRSSFLWSVGPSVGGESDDERHCRTADGEGHCRTADGGWTEVFTSF